MQVDRSQLFCVNCNNHGHPASYRGCPKIIENKKKFINQINNGKSNINNNNMIKNYSRINDSLIRKNTSYTDAVKINPNNITNEPTIIEIVKNIEKLEKIVENNSNRINTIAIMLERFLSINNEQYE